MDKEHLIHKFKNKKGIDRQNNLKYAAMITSLDERIGKISNTLKHNNLEENTLVIFT